MIDLLRSYLYRIELDGLDVGGFSRVSGLMIETETEQYREGGVNEYVHHFVKQTTHGPLVLQRGMTTDLSLWKWYYNVTLGKVERKSGAVILMNGRGEEKCRWTFYEAYPVRWETDDLQGNEASVLVASIHLVHQGLRLMRA